VALFLQEYVISGRKERGFVQFGKLFLINFSVYIWEKATYVFRIQEFDVLNLPYAARGLKGAMGPTNKFQVELNAQLLTKGLYEIFTFTNRK
jgi:hypothetical protein